MENNKDASTNGDNASSSSNSALAALAAISKVENDKDSTTTTTTSVEKVSNFAELLGNDGKFVDGWTSRLPDGLSDYSKTLAKFKSPTELMTSYAQLEKEYSKKSSQSFKVPDENATEEDWAKYKETIGFNPKPEDYGLSRPENVSEELWNAEAASAAANVAAKYGIPKAALGELVEVYNSSINSVVQNAEKMEKERFETTMNSLKKEWGGNTTNNLQKAVRAATAVGLNPEDPAIGNNIEIIKALIKIDEMFGEDKNTTSANANSSTYQEQYDSILRGADYLGKNGIGKQMEAQEKLRNLFNAMNKK
jgi:hypothetical protein